MEESLHRTSVCSVVPEEASRAASATLSCECVNGVWSLWLSSIIWQLHKNSVRLATVPKHSTHTLESVRRRFCADFHVHLSGFGAVDGRSAAVPYFYLEAFLQAVIHGGIHRGRLGD